MKLKSIVPALLLFGLGQAHAALSFYGATTDINGASPQSYAFGAATAVGDMLCAYAQAGVTTTVADSLNGAWSAVPGSGNYDSTTGYYYWWLCKRVTVAGTPTITVTSSGYINDTVAIGITGFTGTPTLDPNFTALQTGTGTSASTVQSSNFNNEVMLAQWASNPGYFTGGLTNGWTVISTWRNTKVGPITTAGTSANTSYTLSASSYWVMSLMGVYDSTTITPTGAAYNVNHVSVSQWVTYSASATLPVLYPGGEYRAACNAASGAVTLTLPTAVLNFGTYHLKKVDSSSNACTFATTSSQTIDGASPVPITTEYATQSVTADNANWGTN